MLTHKILIESMNRRNYRVYCYCFMPDHVHLLLNPKSSNVELSRFIQIFKSKSAVLALKQCGIRRLWQRSYYEHILRESESIIETAEYILQNPVRKGMVSDYKNYRFCGLIDHFE